MRAAGEWVRDFVRRAGGEAELQETDSQPLVIGEIPASSARRRRAHDPRLRPLRRAAAGAARAVGQRPLRADDPRRVAVRARRRRRQGPALDAAQGRRVACGGGRASREHPHRLRRRGGGRRALDRGVPRAGRARCGRLHHLRLGDGAARRARALHGDARCHVVQPRGAHRCARSALRRVRERGAQCDARADAGARRHPAARWASTGGPARRPRAAFRGRARKLERADTWRGVAEGSRRSALRLRRGRRVPPPHDRGAVRRHQRDSGREARAEEHDDPRRSAGELLRPPRAGSEHRHDRRRSRAADPRGRSGRRPS